MRNKLFLFSSGIDIGEGTSVAQIEIPMLVRWDLFEGEGLTGTNVPSHARF